MRNNIIYTLGVLFSVLVLFQSCHTEEGLNYQRYYVNGKGLYEKHCQNCHGAKGEGLGKLYPPLTDTTYLSKNRNRLACIIKNGMKGEVMINNTLYDEPMPGNKKF
jgi:cytochrome c553